MLAAVAAVVVVVAVDTDLQQVFEELEYFDYIAAVVVVVVVENMLFALNDLYMVVAVVGNGLHPFSSILD